MKTPDVPPPVFPSTESAANGQAAPVVSVVIPVYKVEDWLGKTLDSVLAQSFTDWECVCVDDGSPDRSADVVREYAARDARIRLVSQQNAGAAAARNRGMAEARGEFLLFIDSDDLVEPGLMEACVERMRQDKCEMCAFEGDAVDAEARLIEGPRWTVPVEEGERVRVISPYDYPQDVFWLVPVCPWNKMYRLDFLRRHGLAFPCSVRRSEDTPFGVMCLALAERISCLRECFYHYRQDRAGSQTQSVSNPADYYCYIEVADIIWQDMRRHGLLPAFGIGALKIILGNALFYADFLRPQWRMLVAARRLRRLVKRGLCELRSLGAEPSAYYVKELGGMVDNFAGKCRRNYRRHLCALFRGGR